MILTHDLTLIAVFGLIDAPRMEVADAVEQCHGARIKVKMITGDHAVTAATIASQVGIDSKVGVLTGSDIDKMDDNELRKAVDDINVYARTSPNHKLRLVEALQANGELVAMTGDGVNDAPALRKANIGVAMGRKGQRSPRNLQLWCLLMIILQLLSRLLKKGRIVYDNLKKVLLHILPTNAAEAMSVVMAIMFWLFVANYSGTNFMGKYDHRSYFIYRLRI